MILSKNNIAVMLVTLMGVSVSIKSLGIGILAEHINKIDFFICLVCAGLFWATKASHINKDYFKTLVPFGAYIILSLVSSFDNFSIKTLAQLVLNLKFPIFILLFLLIDFKRQGFFSKFIFGIVFINLLLIFLEILSPSLYSNIFTGSVTESVIQGTDIRRYSGLFYHPGPMGVFCGLAILWSVSNLAASSRTKLAYVTIVFALISLILSGQRMEMFATIFVSLLFSTHFFYKRRSKIITKISFLIALTMLVLTLFQMISNITGKQRFDNTSNARYVLYLGGATLANQHFPFGAGLGVFGSSISINNKDSVYHKVGIDRLWWFEGYGYLTDTFWAMVIGESGWFAAFFYLLFIMNLVVFTFKKLLTFQGSPPPELSMAFLGLSYTLIISLTTPVYTGTALPILIVSIFVAKALRH